MGLTISPVITHDQSTQQAPAPGTFRRDKSRISTTCSVLITLIPFNRSSVLGTSSSRPCYANASGALGRKIKMMMNPHTWHRTHTEPQATKPHLSCRGRCVLPATTKWRRMVVHKVWTRGRRLGHHEKRDRNAAQSQIATDFSCRFS